MKFKLNQLLLVGWSYVQTDTATTSNVESCCVRLHVAKRFTCFKLCATTPNNTTQQRATSCNRVCLEGVQTDPSCNIQCNDVRTPVQSRTQHCWPLHVASFFTHCCMLLRFFGSCCIRLYTYATQTQTTRNIVGTTLSGFVVSVCTTQP